MIVIHPIQFSGFLHSLRSKQAEYSTFSKRENVTFFLSISETPVKSILYSVIFFLQNVLFY